MDGQWDKLLTDDRHLLSHWPST